MAELMTDEQLRQRGLGVLEQQLGPVEALRFLALVRREPFDYHAWREATLGGLGVEELFSRSEELEKAETAIHH